MKRLQALTTVSCLTLTSAILAPTASAEEWNKKTVFTFSGPVEIPGVHLTGWAVLPAGTYRLKATDQTVMTFRERPAGEPEALRAWFYPGRNYGEEFVYPKAKAVELAKQTHTPVLFTPAEVPVEVAEPIQSADHPLVLTLKSAPIMAMQPTGDEVELAQVVTPPAAQTEVAMASPASLPATASQLPLTTLPGLLAPGCAIALGVTAKCSV